jgi:hypothetical protein
MVFCVASVIGVEYMEDGDSVWIHETDLVSDDQGNYQNKNQNTRRRLYVKRISLPYTFIPQAVSPVSYQSMLLVNRVPADMASVLGSEGILPDLNLPKNANGDYCGMIIKVVPDPRNIGKYIPDLKAKGTLTILDAVGNTLVLKEKLAWWDDHKSLVWVWNLKNSNGRIVGPGMYVCLFDIEETTVGAENTGIKVTKRLLVGVK